MYTNRESQESGTLTIGVKPKSNFKLSNQESVCYILEYRYLAKHSIISSVIY